MFLIRYEIDQIRHISKNRIRIRIRFTKFKTQIFFPRLPVERSNALPAVGLESLEERVDGPAAAATEVEGRNRLPAVAGGQRCHLGHCAILLK